MKKIVDRFIKESILYETAYFHIDTVDLLFVRRERIASFNTLR